MEYILNFEGVKHELNDKLDIGQIVYFNKLNGRLVEFDYAVKVVNSKCVNDVTTYNTVKFLN